MQPPPSPAQQLPQPPRPSQASRPSQLPPLHPPVRAHSFPAPQWASVSDAAKSAVNDMLTVDPRMRPSAQAMLRHPWVMPAIMPAPPKHAAAQPSARRQAPPTVAGATAGTTAGATAEMVATAGPEAMAGALASALSPRASTQCARPGFFDKIVPGEAAPCTHYPVPREVASARMVGASREAASLPPPRAGSCVGLEADGSCAQATATSATLRSASYVEGMRSLVNACKRQREVEAASRGLASSAAMCSSFSTRPSSLLGSTEP